jgi:tetratricopeptide (TPR) repeat protein
MSQSSPPETIAGIAALARSGRMDEAAGRVAIALATSPDDVALLALSGAIACHRGAFELAATHLRRAHAMRPDDPVIRANLADALFQTGDHAGARRLCDEPSARADRTLRLARLGAYLAQENDDADAAVAFYRIILAQMPNDWAAWNNLGNVHSAQGDAAAAVHALTEAARHAPDAPPIRVNLGQALLDAGRAAEAVAVWRAAATQFADDPHPQLALFRHLSAIGDDEGAYTALTEAARRAPERADIQADFGHIAGHRNAFVVAEAAFQRALSTAPGFTPAIVGLAAVLERVNREDELAALRRRALAEAADAPAVAFIDVLLLKRAGQFEAALAALDTVGDAVIPSRGWQLRGQLLDRVGRHDEAFCAFAAMNRAWLEDASGPKARAASYRRNIEAGLALLTPDWLASWTPAPPLNRRSPIFLVGFPRSGTTLLDTMLLTVPAVRVLEEEPFITDIEAEFGGIAALPGLSPQAIAAARERYFAQVATVTDIDDHTIVVDKHPMHLNKVPVIRRLFPDARFILALRHPCDVLLSCFITNFRLNDAMSNFLDLDDAAALYDLTFRNWLASAALFGVVAETIVYEDLVIDPAAVLRPLFEALALPWAEGQFDHRDAARARGVIRTASYAQVTEPIYRHAAGRWQRYADHLAPIRPVLEPWIRHWGYALKP